MMRSQETCHESDARILSGIGEDVSEILTWRGAIVIQWSAMWKEEEAKHHPLRSGEGMFFCLRLVEHISLERLSDCERGGSRGRVSTWYGPRL